MRQIAPIAESNDGTAQAGAVPCNVEAEQALLGGILVNNDVYQSIQGFLDAEHFFDPVHRRIYELIRDRLARNSIATEITLKPFTLNDPGMAELGGPEYLLKLADSAISVHACKDYAHQIFDLAQRRSLIQVGLELVEKARAVDTEDSATSLIDRTEEALFKLDSVGKVDSGFQSFTKAVTAATGIARLAAERSSGFSGLPTGFIDLDNRLGGLNASDLIVIAGRPSMGKTAFATNIAFNIALEYNRHEDAADGELPNGGRVGFFSLEMSSSQLAARILSERSNITTTAIRRNELNDIDFRNYANAARDIQACPLWIDDTAGLTISQLAVRARRLKQTMGLELLVVDYLQLVHPSSRHEGRVAAVSEVTNGLKAIAKELDIPVIAVSQLSRSTESRDDKRPQLADLRESGSIEQDADVVLFVYREEYYVSKMKPDESDEAAIQKWQQKMDRVLGRAEIHIGKHRNGPTGKVDLSFNGKYTKFGNLAREDMGQVDPGADY